MVYRNEHYMSISHLALIVNMVQWFWGKLILSNQKIGALQASVSCSTQCMFVELIFTFVIIYVVHSIRFQTFLYMHLTLNIQSVIAIHLMRWLTNFYDFSFKWTATATIGIHLTKAWLSQLVNFKTAVWTWGHFRRAICNKILF